MARDQIDMTPLETRDQFTATARIRPMKSPLA
jgi:hypothetical protein